MNDPVGQQRRPTLLGRLGRRGSVVHLLVLLAVVPSLGLPIFSSIFVRDRYRRADSAERVATGLRAVSAVDRLRTAVADETTSAMLGGALKVLDLPPAMLTLVPESAFADAAAAQRSTDAALAAVPIKDLAAIPGAESGFAAVKGALTTDRQDRLSRTGDSVAEFQRMVVAQGGYRARPTIEDLERLMLNAIVGGKLGISTPELLQATARTQAVSAVVIAGQQLVTQFFQVQLSARTESRQLKQFTATAAIFDSLTTALPSMLSPALAGAWQRLIADPQYLSLRASVTAYLDQAQGGRPRRIELNVATVAPLLGVASVAIDSSVKLGALLRQAVTEGVEGAQLDRAEAEARANAGLLATAMVLLLTALLLIAMGGLIRSRLRDLAAAARRLSSGILLPMPVRGPREIAIVSDGLNDAVTNLREVSTKAALIAQGDVTSPLLEKRSPGPLGAAMHASFESVVTMVREREAMQQKLTHQASHDALTGLSNRAEAERLLVAEVDRARQGEGRVGLMFLDLDHFKSCNDSHGHAAGDMVLQTVAHRLDALCDGVGVACRLGGDEFLVIVSEAAGDAQLVEFGQRIVEAVREPVFYAGNALQVGASVGLCAWSAAEEQQGAVLEDAEVAEWMLLRADHAVYRAKSAGRNAAVF